jgi:thymidine kinase
MKERSHSSELLSGKGLIEVITGPMFCGKTDELIRRLRRVGVAIASMQSSGLLKPAELNQRIKVFKPSIDVRRGEDTVNTQDGISLPAIPIGYARDAFDLINKDTMVIAFDESQFWTEEDLVGTCKELSNNKKKIVMVAGLSLNFKGEKWGGVGSLAIEAEYTDVMPAVCTKCGDLAIYTQRIIEQTDGVGKIIRRPAEYNDPVELLGSTNLYEARCRDHHEVPGRPKK